MSHNGLFKLWSLVLILLCAGVFSNVSAQTLNLVTGMTFASDKATFNDKSLSRMPNGFFKLGLGYTSKDNISVSLDYSFDVKYVNLTSTIPIWKIKRKNKYYNKH